MTDTLTADEVAKIQDIIMAQLSVQRDQVTPEAELIAHLGADSLDIAEISMRLEELFDLTLPDDRVEKIVTVGDVYDGVGALLQKRR